MLKIIRRLIMRQKGRGLFCNLSFTVNQLHIDVLLTTVRESRGQLLKKSVIRVIISDN